MGQIIFKNSKTLSTKDIYEHVLIGLGILLLAGLLSPVRDRSQTSWTVFFVLCTLAIIAWTIKALTEKTLKLVEIQKTEVTFVIDRQLRSDKTFKFQLKGLSLDITTKPDRFVPPKKILTVKDENCVLTISTRQKGLSEKSLTEIMMRIKHYPKQYVSVMVP